ncbi:hypothetical protein VTN00DRAFT_8701 [Thermoascus crustaceus]|uniref:uncharacterized protein n=1 Tax=Thermoascus crustaceus TaxID=5088 RepID=UPI0037441F67
MRAISISTTTLLLLLLSFLSPVLSFGKSSQQPPGPNAILLSKVHSLTLRGDRMTTSRRVPPIPQLTCVGPSKRLCALYPIDTMRCTNQGSDYDEEDIQWTCTAELPPEFKLGSTDVVCEGYRSAEDPWVLKGSCGVEYRLALTEVGERRFGHLVAEEEGLELERWTGLLGVGLFVLCIGLILYPLIADCLGFRRNNRPGGNNTNNRPWWGGFWPGGGGPGGGGGDNPPGPPPPYDYPSSNPFMSSTSSSNWRPGFWTGALGGAAAGYELGRRSRERTSFWGGRPAASPLRTTRRYYDYDDYNAGEGSSASAVRFSSTSTSTGFGSTRRR